LIASPFLLADRSACLRRLVIRDLFVEGENEAERRYLDGQMLFDPLVADLVARQNTDGSWNARDIGAGWGAGGNILATGYALSRLGYLGLDQSNPAVQKAILFLKSVQLSDGSWPLSRNNADVDGHGESNPGYDMVPLQTALPLRGLAAAGAAELDFCEKAYDWLLAQRLEDGAWPTGMASGVHGYVAGYRRLGHSRWGCSSNTTGALICFALHPHRRYGEPARRALDLLLSREAHDSGPLGFDTARLAGAEPVSGFFTYYRNYDLALILDLCWRVEISIEDERVRTILDRVISKRNAFGLWSYPDHPQAARWVSFDLSRSIYRLSGGNGWTGSEPRTPFHTYPRQRRRF
jgi:hypothetical protein